jgi:hypothetical protein
VDGFKKKGEFFSLLLFYGMENIKDNIPMGLGELGEPNLTFVRKFRFLLNLEGLGDQWIKKVKIDWVNKVMNLEVYEVYTDGKVPVLEWLKNHGKSGSLATYDGCGKALYAFKFNGLWITERNSDFDYAVSDESTMKITMAFDSYEQIDLAEKKIAEPAPVVTGCNLEFEETEINRLNGAMWLPGKAKPKVDDI